MSIEKKWLIKSDNKVVGPYSADQLENLLLQRQIALIDEVRDMHQRWLYIREVPELKEMTEIVRVELDKRSEQTRTFQSTSVSNTSTGTFSQTMTAESTSIDFTNFSNPAFTDVQVEAREIPFNEVEKKKIVDVERKNQQQKHKFVFSADPVVAKDIGKAKRLRIYTLIFAVLFMIVTTASYSFYKKYSQEKIERALITKVRRLVLIGADTKAIIAYQQLPEVLQHKVLPDILTEFIKLDVEGVINPNKSLQLIKQIPNLSLVQKSQIELIEFNKYLQLNKLKEAKGFLVNAMDLDPDSDIVRENSAILSYLESQYKESSAQFLYLFNKLNKGRFLYGYALNHFKDPQISDLELLEKIERYFSTRVEYQKELTLVQIVLAIKIGNLAVANTYFSDFLKAPVRLSHKFKTSGLVSDIIYKIDKVIPYFDKAKGQLNLKSVVLAALFLNLEKKDAYAAQKIFDQTQAQLSLTDKLNSQIAIYSVLNKNSEMIALEKASDPTLLNLASHLSLFIAKNELKISDTEENLKNLKQQKNIISLWADIMAFKSDELDKIKTFTHNNLSN